MTLAVWCGRNWMRYLPSSDENSDSISNGTGLKIIRFLKDVHESVENTVGLKMHGTPVSLRAYCLVFIYVFPFLFIPTSG